MSHVNPLVATWIELDDLYVLCTSPLLCLLVRPTHKHNLSFSNLPETLVPIVPIEMTGEISEMSLEHRRLSLNGYGGCLGGTKIS
jgi:hypothetical protein